MKAAQIHSYGDVSVIKVVDIEQPSLKDGQVLVKVQAASLNPFDTMVRAGYLQENMPLELPVTLGGDIAGVITEVGTGVSGLVVGDVVYGQANVVAGNSGALAEFAATSASQVAKAPTNISIEEAAALPLVGVSALQALTEHLEIQPGQRLFIHGGAGGIGTVAIQIAKHLGAHVITTASDEGVAYVKDLGADEVIDYKTEDFATRINGVDAAFDTVGGDDFTKIVNLVKPGGKAVSMIASVDPETAKNQNVAATTQSTQVTAQALDRLRQLVEDGAATAHVGATYALNDIQQAFTRRETQSPIGKIVINIAD